MRQEGFDIDQFTRSVAVFLLNAIAETIEFGMTEEAAVRHIYDAFDKLAITMEDKEVNFDEFINTNPFIVMAAKSLLLLINDDETTYTQMKEKFNEIRDGFIEDQNHDFIFASREELENIGFVFWAATDPLMLIPLWIYRLLPSSLELTSINGTKATAFDPMVRVDRPEEDIRFGHLGWGIYVKGE